jgi:hypothetical protein
MLDSKTLGIYILKNKTFYYLEAGDNYIGTSIDRIKKALIQRNLILPQINTNYSKPLYSVITYDEAYRNSYSVEPIFLSKHIKLMYNEKQAEEKGNFK